MSDHKGIPAMAPDPRSGPAAMSFDTRVLTVTVEVTDKDIPAWTGNVDEFKMQIESFIRDAIDYEDDRHETLVLSQEWDR